MGRIDERTGATVYLDTNLFVYAVEGFAEYRAFLTELFAAIDRPVLFAAAEQRAALGISLADAIHVATALLSGCSILLTNVRRLRAPEPLAIRGLE